MRNIRIIHVLVWCLLIIFPLCYVKPCVAKRSLVKNISVRLKQTFVRKKYDEIIEKEEEDRWSRFYEDYLKSSWSINSTWVPYYTLSFCLILAATLYYQFGKSRPLLEREEKDVTKKDDDFIVLDDNTVSPKGLSRVDLGFEGIRLEFVSKQKNKDGQKEVRLLLDGSIRGRAMPGRMLAIMGPSGAGKSTFLHALAGRLKYNPRFSLYGSRCMNGEPVSGDSQIPAAFVEQEVNFFPHMTVRETLNFRVALTMGTALTKVARDKIVQDLLKQLGLSKAADTIVGDSKVRGISGGEKKRLSIAVEMISSPSVIFLDEPTSGLDSAGAAALVRRLRVLASDMGKTVIAVIHQPGQHVFAQFDDLLLLAEGKQIYFGPVSKVRTYMESNGCPVEKEVGTAEHILECVSTSSGEIEAQKRIRRLADLSSIASETIDITGGRQGNSVHKNEKMKRFRAVKSGGPRANILVQFRLLLGRSIHESFRGKAALAIKAFQQLTVGIIYGGIYSLGTNQASIQDRFGLLSLIAIGSSNIAVASTIRAFPKEKTIVSNEIASKMYRTLPYFVAKAVSDLPLVAFYNGLLGLSVYPLAGLNTLPGRFLNFLGIISLHGLASESLGLLLGAISPSSDVALALFPAVLILNIIFDGRNVSPENTPVFLRWVAKVGLIRWGFEGLCVNEFDGLEFDNSGRPRGPVAKTGKDALAQLGIQDSTLTDVVRAQITLTACCWILSYLGIMLTRQKFSVMKPLTKGKLKIRSITA